MNDRTQRAYLEAGVKAAKEGKYDGTTMREVLQWASENVECVRNNPNAKHWVCEMWTMPDFGAPTLYEALHKAWEGRDK